MIIAVCIYAAVVTLLLVDARSNWVRWRDESLSWRRWVFEVPRGEEIGGGRFAPPPDHPQPLPTLGELVAAEDDYNRRAVSELGYLLDRQERETVIGAARRVLSERARLRDEYAADVEAAAGKRLEKAAAACERAADLTERNSSGSRATVVALRDMAGRIRRIQ